MGERVDYAFFVSKPALVTIPLKYALGGMLYNLYFISTFVLSSFLCEKQTEKAVLTAETLPLKPSSLTKCFIFADHSIT